MAPPPTTPTTLDVYQVDAFTNHVFGGNPACVVCLTSEWLPDELMLKIAEENAVAETAFFILQSNNQQQEKQPHKDENNAAIPLRWFTPEIEMDLCGHATLATAHVLFAHYNVPENALRFQTASGILEVTRQENSYQMNFPSRMPQPASLPPVIQAALSHPPIAVYKDRDYLLLYENEQDIRQITVDRNTFDHINLDPGGVIVTAPGGGESCDCDFVSRFFTPQASILEDPVTGSAHCTLIPFWSQRLQKKQLSALQLSKRVGTLYCEDHGSRVTMAGSARTFLIGKILLES